MQEPRRNSNPDYISSILFIALFLSVLIFWHNSYDSPAVERNSGMCETTIVGHNAIICAGIEFHALKICLPCHKVSVLSENLSRISENRKSNLLLTQLENTLYSEIVLPQIFFGCHLFPSEKDDQPPLS